MSKIRNPNINTHLLSSDNFESIMTGLVELYTSCPDASRVRFIQSIEDQLRINAPSRGRSSGSTGISGWRNEQKALYAGRGLKWKRIEAKSNAYQALLDRLNELEADGVEVDTYLENIDLAGYGWVRYSGPRGNEAEQMHAFEIRTQDSRIDHPKQLLLLNNDQASELSTLSATPFSLGLENAQRRNLKTHSYVVENFIENGNDLDSNEDEVSTTDSDNIDLDI